MKSAPFLGAAALGFSLTLHAGGLFLFDTAKESELASSAGGDVRLGNSFADMAAGVTTPPPKTTETPITDEAVPVDQPTETNPVEMTEETKPHAAPQANPVQTMDAAKVMEADQSGPVKPPEAEPVELSAPTRVVTRPSSAAAVAIRENKTVPVLPVMEAPVEAIEPPDLLSSAPVPKVEVTPTPSPETAELTTETTDTAAPETIVAINDNVSELAVPASRPPPRRPPNLVPEVAKAKPPRNPAPGKPVPPRASTGGGQQDTVRGQDRGTTTATATTGGSGTAANATPGNSRAVAQYGNAIMHKISRTRRERTRIRGVALVSFSVAQSGGLASVGIVRSSGNAQLDQIAIKHIRRAAPFPPPPAGAQTHFSIEFSGG